MEDYIHKIWVNGVCVHDSTKNKSIKNFAHESIEGNYRLSIKGNKIVLVDDGNIEMKPTNGLCVEVKCDPEDKFDVGYGVSLAFDRLNNKKKEIERKEAEEKEIKVGDIVEITDNKKSYPRYIYWLYDKVDPQYVAAFDYNELPKEKQGVVLCIGLHGDERTPIAAVRTGKEKVYIINKNSLKKVLVKK